MQSIIEFLELIDLVHIHAISYSHIMYWTVHAVELKMHVNGI